MHYTREREIHVKLNKNVYVTESFFSRENVFYVL